MLVSDSHPLHATVRCPSHNVCKHRKLGRGTRSRSFRGFARQIRHTGATINYKYNYCIPSLLSLSSGFPIVSSWFPVCSWGCPYGVLCGRYGLMLAFLWCPSVSLCGPWGFLMILSMLFLLGFWWLSYGFLMLPDILMSFFLMPLRTEMSCWWLSNGFPWFAYDFLCVA